METKPITRTMVLLASCLSIVCLFGCESSPESEQTILNRHSEEPCAGVWREEFDSCYAPCEGSATWGCAILHFSHCAQVANQKKAICCSQQTQMTPEECIG